mgnify:CR=1 FL=1
MITDGGTNLFGVCELASGMVARGEQGAIVTLICDSGERYLDSYFNPDWLEAQRIDITPWLLRYRCFFEEGRW